MVTGIDVAEQRANASKRKAMSYSRMREEARRLEGEIEALLNRARDTDAEEDARFGESLRGDELPQELRRREDRLAAIVAARGEWDLVCLALNIKRLQPLLWRCEGACSPVRHDQNHSHRRSCRTPRTLSRALRNHRALRCPDARDHPRIESGPSIRSRVSIRLSTAQTPRGQHHEPSRD